MAWRRLVLVPALVVGMAAGVACSKGSDDAGGGGVAGSVKTGELRTAQESDAAGAGDDALGVAAARLPTVGPTVIKTADIEVEVDGRVADAVQEAVQIAEGHGGVAVSTSVTEQDARTGRVLIRVPAENFAAALGDLEDLGDVAHESVSAQDVGQELIDLEARLRHWRSQEAVLLRLMKRSRTVADTIRVQSELQQVQLEVERIRGRLRYLDDQTSLATISMSLRMAGATPRPAGTLARSWQQAADASLAVLSAVIVGTGYVFPIAVLAALLLLALKQLRPRPGS